MKELDIQVPEGYEVDKEKSTFEKIIFKKIKIKLPKTWEEFCEQNPVEKEYFITSYSNIIDTMSGTRNCICDRNLLSILEDTEAHRALMQLHRLRDIYRQGWVPNWNDCTDKWCIFYVENKLDFCRYISTNRFLSFQSLEIAKEFLKNFRELIIKAGDLI